MTESIKFTLGFRSSLIYTYKDILLFTGAPNTFPPFFPPGPPMFNPPNMDLSALSVEQLTELEGQERENVEARIKVLRNVHSLLDAVIVQLNQYSTVINTLKYVFCY